MRPRTQNEGVLRMLRQAGRLGLDQTQVGPPVASDGGPPILRLASRVSDLKAAGHEIVHAGRRYVCQVYRLTEGVGRVSASQQIAPTSTPRSTAETGQDPCERLTGPIPARQAQRIDPYDPWDGER